MGRLLPYNDNGGPSLPPYRQQGLREGAEPRDRDDAVHGGVGPAYACSDLHLVQNQQVLSARQDLAFDLAPV